MGLLGGSDSQSKHSGVRTGVGEKGGQQYFIHGIRVLWQ